jgi:hypothetical protein
LVNGLCGPDPGLHPQTDARIRAQVADQPARLAELIAEFASERAEPAEQPKPTEHDERASVSS